MAETSRVSYPISTVGVGKADYSSNIEQSVEPLIRSYQSEYDYINTVTIGPGATQTIEVTLPANVVCLIYDIYVTNPNNVLVDVLMEFLAATGGWFWFAAKQAMMTVEIHFTKGWPLFNKYRFNITNTGAAADFIFSAHGIQTAETEYYGGLIFGAVP